MNYLLVHLLKPKTLNFFGSLLLDNYGCGISFHIYWLEISLNHQQWVYPDD